MHDFHHDKDEPLLDDIRLLGQILGETVREQEGDAVFGVIETIRRLSVAVSRQADAGAADELDRLLHSLSPAETVSVMRAFSYFSHLANIAEDRHHVRRRALHEAEGAHQEGSLVSAFERLLPPALERSASPPRLPRPMSRRSSLLIRLKSSARARSMPNAPSPACWRSAMG